MYISKKGDIYAGRRQRKALGNVNESIDTEAIFRHESWLSRFGLESYGR